MIAIAIIVILLLALLIFLLNVESKIRDAFSSPLWLYIEDDEPLFDPIVLQSQWEQLRKYKVGLDAENTEFNYGHEVGKYHSDDD